MISVNDKGLTLNDPNMRFWKQSVNTISAITKKTAELICSCFTHCCIYLNGQHGGLLRAKYQDQIFFFKETPSALVHILNQCTTYVDTNMTCLRTPESLETPKF